MKKFDLVIQENDSWDHFNTGKPLPLSWCRKAFLREGLHVD